MEDPEYDVGEFIVNPDTQKYQAAGMTKDRDEWMILDEAIREDLEIIRTLNRGDFFFLNRDSA